MTGESLVSGQLKISPEVEIAPDNVLGWVTRVPDAVAHWNFSVFVEDDVLSWPLLIF